MVNDPIQDIDLINHRLEMKMKPDDIIAISMLQLQLSEADKTIKQLLAVIQNIQDNTKDADKLTILQMEYKLNVVNRLTTLTMEANNV